MSADQLANHLGIPVIVARERYFIIFLKKWLLFILFFYRLIAAETKSLLCRDDSIEGLRFYPNFFWLLFFSFLFI
jgi:hypothetical protein